MECVIVHVQALPPTIYRKLYYLNFRNKSHMQKKLSLARKGKIQGHAAIAFAPENPTHILGWTLIWRDYRPSAKYHHPIVYFYVRHRVRRQGVGSFLLKRSQAFCTLHYRQEAAVWAHDRASQAFFDGSGEGIQIYYGVPSTGLAVE